MADATVTAPVPAPVVRQAGEPRSARIESLRALAAVGVLAGHVYGTVHHYNPAAVFATFPGRVLYSGGFGVFLFFALSGYLLYLPFARSAFGDRGPIDLTRYAVNRVLRILPLYWVVVGVFLLLDLDGERSQWWRYLVFAENNDPGTVARLDGPLWSLVVEVQFYVLLPVFAAAVAWVSRRSLRRAAAVVAILAAAALALRVLTVTTGQPSAVWRYSLPATCVFFFPGLLLALARVRIDQSPPGWLDRPVLGSPAAWFAAGVGLWLLVADRFNDDPLLLVASALLLGACALPMRSDGLHRTLDARWLAGLGAASYSLYLWHDPIVTALGGARWLPAGLWPLLVVSVAVCVVVAALSYQVVEAPFLRWRRSWSTGRVPEELPMESPRFTAPRTPAAAST